MTNRCDGKLCKARGALLVPTVVAQPKEDCQPEQRVLVPFLYEPIFCPMISLILESPRDSGITTWLENAMWFHHVIDDSDVILPRDCPKSPRDCQITTWSRSITMWFTTWFCNVPRDLVKSQRDLHFLPPDLPQSPRDWFRHVIAITWLYSVLQITTWISNHHVISKSPRDFDFALFISLYKITSVFQITTWFPESPRDLNHHVICHVIVTPPLNNIQYAKSCSRIRRPAKSRILLSRILSKSCVLTGITV